MFKFQDYGFDKVIILHLIEDIKRKDFIEWQLDQLGIDKNSIEWHIAVKHPFGYELTMGFNSVNAHYMQNENRFIGRFTKPNEISCLREHYTIVKKAYYEGTNRILVLEDDIRFNKDIEFLKSYMSNIPEDADFLQGDCFTTNTAISPKLEESRKTDEEKWVLHAGIGVWNASFISYNRKAMKFFLDYIDTYYMPADMPVFAAAQNEPEKYNCYVSKYPLVFQENCSEIPSNIRSEQLQTYYQDKANLYLDGINKDDYFSYKSYQKQIN